MLVSNGHEVTVMTGIPNVPIGKFFKGFGLLKNLKGNYYGVTILRNWLIPRGNGSRILMTLNYLSFVLFSSIGLLRLIGKRYDVIFVNQLSPITVAIPAIFYKWITGKRIVMWVHDLWPDSVIAAGALKKGFLYNCIGNIVTFIYRNCDFFFPQSLAMLNTLESRGIPRNKMKYLPNVIDTFFNNISLKKTHPIFNNIPRGFYVMFAGSIGKSQDFKTILRAAKLIESINKDIKFIIVGDGRERIIMEKLKDDLNLSETFFFLGSFPVKEMPSFYSMADVMLVTLRDEEIFSVTVPLKVQTYMACGKPIISNIEGEAKRVIKEANCGFIAKPQDPESLAKSIEEAYQKRGSELKKLGSNARSYFDKSYNQDILIKNIEKLLNQVVSKAEFSK